MELPEIPMADLANIRLRLTTHGNVVVALDMPNPKEIDEMLNDDNDDPTTYGFMLRKVIQQFEEEYDKLNITLKTLIRNVKVE
tara:strand:- start:135 stop:383 length:249 start_codon:yes stop_codon:yes gene_type:complete